MLKITSASYNVSNEDNLERKYNITASVSVANGTVQSLNSGSITDKATGAPVADFSKYGTLSVNFHNSADATLLTAINDFIVEVNTQFNENV